MTDTAPMLPKSAIVHLRASWWWSRHDDLANYQLAEILTRHGYPCTDINAPEAVDAALRAAVNDEAALDELADWVEMIAARRDGNGTQNPRHSLGGQTDYLTRALAEKPLSATTLRKCRRQVGFADQILRNGRDLPELVNPDANMTDLLHRYREIRGAVLTAEPTEK
ncbi:hypothetical protein ABH922_005724 [Rhodococcus sp. 27YEA15]|uniref:hypothetical protein n=1 Tax=Rhodococcus sp. 27YEA15 TaxID=3156259 RepID=UPI003C7D1335